MATTIDKLRLLIETEGIDNVRAAVKELDNLDKATKKVTDTQGKKREMDRGAINDARNLALGLSGVSGEAAGLGRDIGDLIGNFGRFGPLIGGIAAVAIPAAIVAVKAMGIDFRNLNEILKEGEERVKAFKDAQQLNAQGLGSLRAQFGDAAGAAERFYAIQEGLTRRRADIDLGAGISKVQKEFGFVLNRMNELNELRKKAAEASLFSRTPRIVSGSTGLEQLEIFLNLTETEAYRLKVSLGLSVEEGIKLGQILKDLDKNAPEKNVQVLAELEKYLRSITEGDDQKFKKIFDEAIDPILKANNLIFEFRKNIRAAGEQASLLSQNMMFLEYAAAPDIAAARRNFDQVTAIRREGELKYQQFKFQLDEKTRQDGVDREGELTVFRLRNEQEIRDKIADVAQSQKEAYHAATQTNEAKKRQLNTESRLLDIQRFSTNDAQYNIEFNKEIVRIAGEYANTLANIREQERTRKITSADSLNLQAQAQDLQQRQVNIAKKARDDKVFEFINQQQIDLMNKSIEDQISRMGTLGDILANIRKETGETQRRTQGLDLERFGPQSELQKQVRDITENYARAGREAARNFARPFEAMGGELTEQQSAELANGLNQIEQAYRLAGEAQVEFSLRNYEVTRSFQYGWQTAFEEYRNSAKNAAEEAATIFRTTTRSMEDLFVNFARTGKFEFNNFAESVIADIVRISVRRSILAGFGFFGALGGGGTDGVVGYGGAGDVLPRAQGGPVSPNQPYLTGEAGPEIFIPKSAGTIIPNNQIDNIGTSLGSTNVVYNISAVDAASFKQLVARDPQFIYNVTEAGRRSQPSRRLS